jgi:signal transduction histidine kinase
VSGSPDGRAADTDSPSAGAPGSALRDVAHSVVAGIAHDLSGRLTALLGIAQIVKAGMPLDDELIAVLDDQARRIEFAIRQLRLIPFLDRMPPLVSSLRDVVSDSVVLYEARSGGEPVRIEVIDGGDAAVRGTFDRPLREALLLLLLAAEQPHGHAARAAPVTVEHGTNDGIAFVRIHSASDTDLTNRSRDAIDEARTVAGLFDGTVERTTVGDEPEGWTVTVRLPALG